MTIRRIPVLPLLVKFPHISFSELWKSSCNKRYPIKLRLNSGGWVGEGWGSAAGGRGAGRGGAANKWTLGGKKGAKWWTDKTREKEGGCAFYLLCDVQSFSLRAKNYNYTEGDGGDWLNCGMGVWWWTMAGFHGRSVLKAAQWRFPVLLAVVWNGDNRS